jgi:hypothetical protein
MIGSLSHLIRSAALEAITDGTEQITKSAPVADPTTRASCPPGTWFRRRMWRTTSGSPHNSPEPGGDGIVQVAAPSIPATERS